METMSRRTSALSSLPDSTKVNTEICSLLKVVLCLLWSWSCLRPASRHVRGFNGPQIPHSGGPTITSLDKEDFARNAKNRT